PDAAQSKRASRRRLSYRVRLLSDLPGEGHVAQRAAGDEVAAEGLVVLFVEQVADVEADAHVGGDLVVGADVDELVGGHVADEDAGRPAEAVDPAEAGGEVEAVADVGD